jgi:hypothetical protein
MEFAGHDRGKRVSMADLWEIERERIKDTPGEIVLAVIP